MASTPNTETADSSAPPTALTGVAAGARILMGLVLIVAGVAKSFEPVLFYWEAISYLELLEVARDSWPQLARLTLALAPLEVLIGGALVVGWRPKITFPISTALMLLFIAVTGLAWFKEAPIDCGCFGTLAKRTPGQALVEDIVLLALLVGAWRWGATRWTAVDWAPAPKVIGIAFLAAAGVMVLRFAPESDRIANSDLKPGLRLKGLEVIGQDLDLTEGSYLIEFFSPRCGHCKAAVPKLNKWADTAGIPRIVALTEFPPGSEHTEAFVEQMRPRYHLGSIASSDWMRLTWRHGYPRLAYVEDGIIRNVWERDTMPSTAQLQRLGGG